MRRMVWLALGLAWAAGEAAACNVPVFRYALERWEPAPYELLVFCRGKPAPEEEKVLEALRRYIAADGPKANLVMELLDADQPLPAQYSEVWRVHGGTKLPRLLLRYPYSTPQYPSAWEGGLDQPEALRALLDSPSRREIARRILSGDSVVWLLVASGNQAKDEAAEKMLNETLAEMQKALKLPGREELEDPQIPERERLRAALQLQLRFSALKVARSPEEQPFINLLLLSDLELPREGFPLAVPVFGQGRALDVLAGPRLTKDLIGEVSEFLCGPCSCIVKEQNPGFDLLMAADWYAAIEDRAVRDPETPNLAVLAPALAPPPPVAPPAQPARTATLQTALLVSGLLGLLFLTALSLMVLSRRGRRGG